MQTTSHLKIHNQNICLHTIQIHANSQKPTIVFLHEGLGSVAQWKDFPKTVCNLLGLNGIVYDRQGHGQSAAMTEKRGTDYLHIEALKFLPELLQKLNIEKPILMGHSDGATIALLYAAFFPKNVRAVVAESAHIKVEDLTLQGIATTVNLYKSTDLRQKLQKHHDEKTDDLFQSWAKTWLNPNFRDWNIADVLPHIDCPVLLLQGKQDEYASEQHLWEIAEGIGKTAKAILVENCGHTPHRSQREVVLKEIVAFLKEFGL